jgi:hypothetical protein
VAWRSSGPRSTRESAGAAGTDDLARFRSDLGLSEGEGTLARADLQARDARADEEPFAVLVFDGDGSRALVDLDDNRVLQELMDTEEHSDAA